GFFFFQAEDGIRDRTVTEFRRVLFRSSVRSEPRGVTPPAANNAFSGVESELMSYAPGCATSPTTYTRTVLSRERDTSAETFRYWVLSTCCTACCVSPRLRPLTSSGPTSGSDTRPSLSTRRNIRWETPPQRSISRPSPGPMT